MTEADFTRDYFAPFVATKYDGPTFAFEAKMVKTGKTLAFSKIPAHQDRALRMTNSETGIYHKISDESRVQKPFDGFFLRKEKAYVVICYLEYGQFAMVDIPDLVRLKENNPKLRSISLKQCLEIGMVFDMHPHGQSVMIILNLLDGTVFVVNDH